MGSAVPLGNQNWSAWGLRIIVSLRVKFRNPGLFARLDFPFADDGGESGSQKQHACRFRGDSGRARYLWRRSVCRLNNVDREVRGGTSVRDGKGAGRT